MTYELDPDRDRLVEYRWDCGCVLSDVADDETCHEHRHIPVIREGAALRTGDELLELFVEDARDVLTTPITPGGFVSAGWVACLEQCAEDHAVHGAWLGNDDLREELEDVQRQAEDQLTAAGWIVEWDDGYVIWRPTADAPAEELRRQREQQDALDD